MAEVKTPKKSDNQQKKKKTAKRSRRNKSASVRYRDMRPDCVHKIRRTLKSCGYETARKLYEKLVEKDPKPGLQPIRMMQKLLADHKDR